MTRFTALASRLRSPFRVVGEVAAADMTTLASSLRCPLRIVCEVSTAHLAAFAAGLGGSLWIVREIATADLAAFAAGFGGSLWIAREIATTRMSALARDRPLARLVHRGESAPAGSLRGARCFRRALLLFRTRLAIDSRIGFFFLHEVSSFATSASFDWGRNLGERESFRRGKAPAARKPESNSYSSERLAGAPVRSSSL